MAIQASGAGWATGTSVLRYAWPDARSTPPVVSVDERVLLIPWDDSAYVFPIDP